MQPWRDHSGRFSPLKATILALLFVPGIWIAWAYAEDQLGPRPLNEAIHQTGLWALRFLLITLAVTPLRQSLQWPRLLSARRMLGLAAFGYLTVHFSLYVTDQAFDLGKVASEIALRYYLLIGFTALLLMCALAATSTDAMQRRLGGRNWQRLHRAVYVIGTLGLLHHFMQRKLDIGEPTFIAGFFSFLMLYRIAGALRRDRRPPRYVVALLCLAAALLTALGEAGWFWWKLGAPPLLVLDANLGLETGIRPAMIVLGAGALLSLLILARAAQLRLSQRAVRRVAVAATLFLGLVALPSEAEETRPWPEIVAAARGQTVHWNAWAGDEHTNAFIAWTNGEMQKRYGVTVEQVKLKDTSEAVTRVVAEKQAGRDGGGSVDFIWINGPNFLAMKEQGLLYGPFATHLPNFALVDTVKKPSNVTDFTVPVDGMESPWRMAQIVYVDDSARLKEPPRTIAAMLDWARQHPGRLTHPTIRNFLGSTFLKQALYELVPDPAILQRPATDENFTATTAPLWAWYDALRPLLWRQGTQFPESGPAQRQLLNDGEIDLMIAFNPAEAAVGIASGLLPDTARVYTLERGTIGNTSFVAIPYNASAKEGAMVLANFLLEPATQARAQDVRGMGSLTVLDLDKLSPADRRLFAALETGPAMPTAEELGPSLLEPHPSWMTRITAEWERRYVR
jgi:putative thiamine transport system substrate-binding protein